MRFQKKAQQSRNDLVVWYLASLIIVIVVVGSLYGFGVIGKGISHGALIDSNKVTAAAIAVPVEEPPQDNNSLPSDNGIDAPST